jgi:hypothetical protein
LIVCLLLLSRRVNQRFLFRAVGVLLVGDLLWFSCGRSAQCDPAFYYPEIPALRQVAAASPGRVIGNDCLPAKLAAAIGLRDVRGYDSVDPDKWFALLAIAADRRSPAVNYAMTQWLIPRLVLAPPDTVRLSPILDMMGVRYVIFRGQPPPDIQPKFQSPDYWVMENKSALPRAFIPQRVEMVPEVGERLRKLADAEFDPRQVAYVETSVDLPPDCRGTVEIADEIPSRIMVKARMETPGLLVLADFWDQGWQACVEGKPAPILRANHALRAVALPAGAANVEFRYESATVKRAFQLAGASVALLIGWVGFAAWQKRKPRPAVKSDRAAQ